MFKDHILEGIPSSIPVKRELEKGINHAPKRKQILTEEEWVEKYEEFVKVQAIYDKCKKCSNVDYLIPYNLKEDWICNSCILDIKKLIIKSAF